MPCTKGSATSPRLARARPKKREKVMMPRMFMSTAATAMFSGKMLRATPRSAVSGETGSSSLSTMSCRGQRQSGESRHEYLPSVDTTMS